MPETNWGRKETIIWPPHKPIYTFGAVFFAVVLTGLFVYLHFAFVLTPLQQFDLPIYIKTTIVASIRQSSKYQLLLMADKKGHVLYEGRRSFANIMKYIIMGTSSNFGNMFSMAGASLFLPFLPMLPTQILLNNFRTTFSMTFPRSASPATMLILPCCTGPSDGKLRSFASS
jgi:hypothetical protein